MNPRQRPIMRAVMAMLACAMVHGAALAQTDAPPIRGVAEPSRRVTLHAPVDGVLASVPIDEGQQVEAGALLASMDAEVQQAQLAIAELQARSDVRVHQATLRLEESATRYERIVDTAESGAAEKWEVRQALLQKRLAEAEKRAAEQEQEVAEARLKLEKARLAMYRLKAPWAGLVHRVEAEPGATLSRRDPVVELVQIDQLEAELFLPVELFGKVEQGERYWIEAEAPVGRKLPATLKRYERVIDAASGTFRAIFVIDNADNALPAGFAVELPWPQPRPAPQAPAE